MTKLIKYAGLAVLVLAALVVLMMCGELLCDAGGHACLNRVDRTDRLRRAVARLFDRLVSAARVLVGLPVVTWAMVPRPPVQWNTPSFASPTPLLI